MDSSIIARRYALSLLKYVAFTGGGERVCDDIMRLEEALGSIKEFSLMVDAPEGVSAERKVSLFNAALRHGSLAPETERFIRLVIRQERIGLIRLMFHDFIELYRREQKLVYGHLKSVVPPTEQLLEYLRDKVYEATGCKAVITTETDPSLIGGFVFETDDYMMDASVRTALEDIRRTYIDNNRRIV